MGDGHAGSGAGPGRRGSLAARFLVTAVKAYRRVLSPLLPPSCIFEPTCSVYAITAIDRFGALRGSWLAFRRIMRCHPFRSGGYDPVPDTWENRR